MRVRPLHRMRAAAPAQGRVATVRELGLQLAAGVSVVVMQSRQNLRSSSTVATLAAVYAVLITNLFIRCLRCLRAAASGVLFMLFTLFMQ